MHRDIGLAILPTRVIRQWVVGDSRRQSFLFHLSNNESSLTTPVRPKVGTSSMTPVALFYLFRVYSKAPPSRVQFSLPKKFCFTACARLSLWEFACLFSHKAVKMSLIWFSNYDSDRADSLRNSLPFDPTAQAGFSCRSRRDDEVVSRQSSKWCSVFQIVY